MRPVIALFVALLSVAACERKSEPAPTPAASASAALASTTPTPASTAPASAPVDPVTARAQAALRPLKQNLKAALTAAMAQGPDAAITACRDQAPTIAQAASAAGIVVGRTSHKLRNPANAPEPWARGALADYVAGRRVGPITVEIDANTMGYLEPIKVEAMCLTCHGTAIEPGLAAKLKALYPEDAATGFAEGDLRGLFYAKVPKT